MKAYWTGILAAALLLAAAPSVAGDEALAGKSGCLECHGVDAKKIGPAFHDVAARYKGNPKARGALIEKVKRGGRGNWTQVTGGEPMPPHGRRLSDEEIQRLVDWVLGR